MSHRDDFTFWHRLRVRWSEVDRQDIVFNPHYFTYFDIAVTEYWRAAGLEYPQVLAAGGTDFFAKKATAEFFASATFDDVLDVGCRAGRLGTSSMQLLLVIYRGADKLTAGELIYVHADVAAKKAVPWPQMVRDAVLKFERVPPQG